MHIREPFMHIRVASQTKKFAYGVTRMCMNEARMNHEYFFVRSIHALRDRPSGCSAKLKFTAHSRFIHGLSRYAVGKYFYVCDATRISVYGTRMARE